MKKSLLLFALAAILTVNAAGCSKGYESQKRTGDVVVTLKADRYPLVKGDNAIALFVTDSSGKPVTDAAVAVRYYMPPMPGMAPMDFTTQAQLKGTSYSFVANPSMEGGWKVEATVARPGKQEILTTFNLDAR